MSVRLLFSYVLDPPYFEGVLYERSTNVRLFKFQTPNISRGFCTFRRDLGTQPYFRPPIFRGGFVPEIVEYYGNAVLDPPYFEGVLYVYLIVIEPAEVLDPPYFEGVLYIYYIMSKKSAQYLRKNFIQFYNSTFFLLDLFYLDP